MTEIEALGAQVEQLTAERDEVRAWVRRLTAAERVLTCVYCGEAYPPGTPDHGADVLTAHIRTCAKHPMREVERERDELRAEVDRLRADLERTVRASLASVRLLAVRLAPLRDEDAADVVRERDELRAEVDRLRAEMAGRGGEG